MGAPFGRRRLSLQPHPLSGGGVAAAVGGGGWVVGGEVAAVVVGMYAVAMFVAVAVLAVEPPEFPYYAFKI